MKRLVMLAAALVAAGGGFFVMRRGAISDGGSWMSSFLWEAGELSPTGRNPWFILEPGYTLVLENEDASEQLIITVLTETKRIGDVEARVVEEREFEDGAIKEVSRNFFAISERTTSVYYFGEDVDIYEDGKVVEHEGAWLSGTQGARAGLMMPGDPLPGSKYYQEIAPGVAMDRAEIVGLSEALETPLGTLSDLLKVEETTPLEPGVREYKYYARGIGLVLDGSLKLVRYGNDIAR